MGVSEGVFLEGLFAHPIPSSYLPREVAGGDDAPRDRQPHGGEGRDQEEDEEDLRQQDGAVGERHSVGRGVGGLKGLGLRWGEGGGELHGNGSCGASPSFGSIHTFSGPVRKARPISLSLSIASFCVRGGGGGEYIIGGVKEMFPLV